MDEKQSHTYKVILSIQFLVGVILPLFVIIYALVILSGDEFLVIAIFSSLIILGNFISVWYNWSHPWSSEEDAHIQEN